MLSSVHITTYSNMLTLHKPGTWIVANETKGTPDMVPEMMPRRPEPDKMLEVPPSN